MISILHPSRARSVRSLHTLSKWKTNAAFKTQIEIIISVDEDDAQLNDYQKNATELGAILVIGENKNAVDAINRAARASSGRIIIVVSDDTDCPKHWDNIILEETVGEKDWIVKFKDGIQDWIITMPVMDRAYYNRFGYIYFPEYHHMFCDTELTAVADLTGRLIKSDFLFPHLHYSITPQGAKDGISAKADSTWDQGKKLFLERVQINFGLEKPVGRITEKSYLNWIEKESKNLV